MAKHVLNMLAWLLDVSIAKQDPHSLLHIKATYQAAVLRIKKLLPRWCRCKSWGDSRGEHVKQSSENSIPASDLTRAEFPFIGILCLVNCLELPRQLEAAGSHLPAIREGLLSFAVEPSIESESYVSFQISA